MNNPNFRCNTLIKLSTFALYPSRLVTHKSWHFTSTDLAGATAPFALVDRPSPVSSIPAPCNPRLLAGIESNGTLI